MKTSERSLNEVRLLGRLGKDSETRILGNGTAVTTFTVATSHRYKSGEEWKEQTDWHSVKLWRSENLAKFLNRGTRVHVSGRLTTESYDKDGVKKYVTYVVADEVILLGTSSENRTAGGADGWD